MIVAAGLTPAWQHILLFDDFKVDTVNRAKKVHWASSGKVLNVGIALHRLGTESKTVAPLGGISRSSVEREFRELGVPARWVDSSTATRICTTVLDLGTGIERNGGDGHLQMTELVENADPLGEGEYESFLGAFAEEAESAEVVVLTGSLPRETPTSFYRDLIQRTSAPAIVDARGPELRAALSAGVFLVKPNRDELASTVGRAIASDEDLRRALAELHHLGAEWAVISRGKRAVWISSADGDLFVAEPPQVDDVANPIGCGDCLAAGIAWGIREGRSVPDSVKIGVGAAVQNLRDVLPSRLDIDTVLSLAESVVVQRQ